MSEEAYQLVQLALQKKRQRENTIKIVIHDEEIKCPKCGAGELANPDAPVSEWRFNIKAFKVHDGKRWKSHCLVCDTWF